MNPHIVVYALERMELLFLITDYGVYKRRISPEIVCAFIGCHILGIL